MSRGDFSELLEDSGILRRPLPRPSQVGESLVVSSPEVKNASQSEFGGGEVAGEVEE